MAYPDLTLEYSGEVRLLSKVLNLYYQDEMNQTEIGKLLGFSTSKVNRLLRQARDLGMVQIIINTPFNHLFELEKRFENVTGIQKAIIVPTIEGNEALTFNAIGKAASEYLSTQISDNDCVCLGGGTAVYETVQRFEEKKFPTVTVVPAIGGVQGCHETDVNNLASSFANKISGISYSMHAPAFTDSLLERDILMNVRQIREVFEKASHAQIAVFGVGMIRPETASFFRFSSFSKQEISEIIHYEHAVGEIMAHIYDGDGRTSMRKFEERTIGITLDHLKNIPLTIGIAMGGNKAKPIAAAIRGNMLKTLVTDENTSKVVLECYS